MHKMQKMFKADLFNAVESRNLKKVKSVLKKRPDAIHKTKNGDSPLHVATTLGFTDIMEILIQNGHNVNKKNTTTGITPLHIACGNAHLDSVIVLLENDAEPSTQCGVGNTPLHEVSRAGNIKIIKFLFNYEFDINITNDEGWTALHRAVFSNREDAVQILCQQGIDISIRNNSEKTAHDVACQYMYFDLAEIIRNHEKKPNHPKTVIQNQLTAYTTEQDQNESPSKIENLFEIGKEGFKSLFTWKPSSHQQENDESITASTTSISEPYSITDNNDETEGNDCTNTNNTILPFFEKISNLTLHLKSNTAEKAIGENKDRETERISSSTSEETKTSETIKAEDNDKENEPNIENAGDQEKAEEEKPDDDIHECPVCFEIPLPPTHIYQCQNGHLYCGNCKEMPNMFNCPQCNVDIASSCSRNRYAEENISRLYKNRKE